MSFNIHFLTKQFIVVPGRIMPGQPPLQPVIDNDPVPLWPNDSISTSPVEIEIQERFEKDGLSVDIIPTKPVFKAGEPLSFSVIYRNVGQHPFRLPDQPALNDNWHLNFTRGNSASFMNHLFAAKTAPPTGVPTPARPTAPLEPGKTLAVEVAFPCRSLIPPPIRNQLFPKKYKANIDIHFAAKPPADDQPVPLWPNDSIMTNPAEFEIER